MNLNWGRLILKKVLTRKFAYATLLVTLALFVTPTVYGQNPSYDMSFEPTTPESAMWRPHLFGMPMEFQHIYGNFSITITNPVNVDFVTFRFGEYNTSKILQDMLGWDDVVLNLTTEPFVWEFDTSDLPEGLHRFQYEVTRYNPPSSLKHIGGTYSPASWTSIGGTLVLYVEHQDSSQQAAIVNTLSIFLATGLVMVLASISIAVIFKFSKKKTKSISRSRFERSRIE